MKIALIGKPSVGKSTFFKAATLAEVKIASYPFTTLKSSEGVGYVRIECLEKEFNTKCNPQKGFCINGQRFVPVKLVDIPGLVEGSHRGLGMGNEFLSDVMQADAFIHIVDVSGETDIEGKPSKDHDPSKDIEFLEEELDMWYYNIFIKAWKSFARKTEMEKGKFSEAVAKQFSGLKVTEDQVKEALRKLGLDEKPTLWKDSDLKEFASILRKISKPMIIAANKIDLLNSKKNYEKLLKEFPDLMIVPCSADSELALRQAVKSDLIDYIPGNKSFIILKDL
ncbi:MAG: 50S ribosome-binding GTPase, partial [Nanoarchaeota archaeon]|nr:50S ribosome-binding GTPase [Nanoarchaeota archaeon]